ncbi:MULTISPECIES: hypothetical protein [Bacillus]|uniref:hypothetical protein n=1 Tax=Bacillus TaxID=1386 RepID=UPI0008A87816|nr:MULTISPECIES: hypothetical protein [Bacillus]HDR3313502.1 hypothetical protein [Bacillus thuringiensis]MEC2943338.1 hypothetical protein [Bacillus cereus]MEC3178522.1 hypothetical protein [Bacillus cereus]OHO76442.1 hypothetical protein HMPREF2590_00010 [Bacillus sp. HMSC036E02]PES65951.1 hypothetical protein CN512_20305 [Bacillus cereus]
MIRFIMLDNKQNEFNFKNYTDELMRKVEQTLNLTHLSFNHTEESKRSCSLILAEKEYFVDFSIMFNLLGADQLRVDISTKENTAVDKDLHDLKIMLKDLMVEEWMQCVWLVDYQSEEFAEDLYKNIHSVENSLRRLINAVLSHHLGIEWWSFMPTHLTKKYSQRINGYREKAPGFKDVYANLLSIDTSDLISILKFKTYKIKSQSIFNTPDPFSPDSLVHNPALVQFQYIMSDIINNDKSIEDHRADLTKLLEEQMEVDIDFWESFFSPLFSCTLREFSGKWENFSKDRNHVAHNKLIDDKLYRKFKKVMDDLFGKITEAEEKFEEVLKIKSDDFLEYMKMYEAENLHRVQIESRQAIAEQAGIEILSQDQIFFLFLEHVHETFGNISDTIYYRTDIDVTYDEPETLESEKIFEVKNNILGTSIHVDADTLIDEEVGCTSTLKLSVYYNANLKENFEISFLNGEAEYNDDQGTYMPKIADELDVSDLEKIENYIFGLLEKEMPEISEDDLASFIRETIKRNSGDF